MPRLLLRLLGTFSLSVDDKPITAFKSDKGRALLAYLAVEAERSHRRERLAGLLWPDFPDRAALARLSDTLSNLRRILNDHGAAGPFLTITPTTLQFNMACDCALDLREFEGLTQPLMAGAPAVGQLADYEAAVAAYRGPFLEGFSLKDSADFEEWVLLKREQMAQRMVGALRGLATLYERRGEYEAAQRHAARLIQSEPLDEENYRVLMRILAAAGNRSGALAVYENCRAVLAREFKVEPDRETAALRDAIRSDRLAAAAAPERLVYRENKPEQEALPVHPLDAIPAPRAAPAENRPLLVARERELSRLHALLAQALGGQGRVVFVTGEAGAGKSALMEEFAHRALAEVPNLIVARGNCNALVGIGDPYLPFRDVLQTLAFGRDLAVQQALVENGPDLLGPFVPAAPLLARLKAAAEQAGGDRDHPAAGLAEVVRRQSAASTGPAVLAALFEQFTEVLRSIAARRPLLLLVNDLQWADGGSISLLFHLGRRLGDSRVLFVGGYRPDDVELGRDGSRHPLDGVVNELEREFGDLRISLPATPGRAFVDALLDSQPNVFPEAFREALTCRTGGHPLFTVELLRGLQERGDVVRDAQGRWMPGPALDWDALPSRIEAVLAERVGRLPIQQRELLEVGSVEGEGFTVEVAAAVLGVGGEEVGRALGGPLRRTRLVAPAGLHRLGARRLTSYRFTHYVLRQYLYSRLDPLDRMRLHEAVGQALEALYGEQVPEIVVQLAWHFDQAGLADEAAGYLLRAGAHAMRLSAYREAIIHFERGLALLATVPPSPERTRREAALRMPLMAALTITRGWGADEPSHALAPAGAPAGASAPGAADAVRQAVLLLVVQADVRLSHGEVEAALRIGEEALARAGGDRQAAMLAHGSLGIVRYAAGDLRPARNEMTQMLALYRLPEDTALAGMVGFDPAALAMVWLAPTLWLLGYGDQALAKAEHALRIAEELGQPFTRATALVQKLLWYALAGLPADHEAGIADLLRLVDERGYATVRGSTEFLRAWWMTRQGQVEAGVAGMQAILANWRTPGNVVRLPAATAIYAQVCLEHGLIEAGLPAVEEMLSQHRRGISRLVEPELHRLRGEFLPAEAEACFVRAIEVAREQCARAWELRAAMSLARLWQRQGKHREAREVLAGVYGWFSEGFDTPDLRAAAALLAALSGQRATAEA